MQAQSDEHSQRKLWKVISPRSMLRRYYKETEFPLNVHHDGAGGCGLLSSPACSNCICAAYFYPFPKRLICIGLWSPSPPQCSTFCWRLQTEGFGAPIPPMLVQVPAFLGHLPCTLPRNWHHKRREICADMHREDFKTTQYHCQWPILALFFLDSLLVLLVAPIWLVTLGLLIQPSLQALPQLNRGEINLWDLHPLGKRLDPNQVCTCECLLAGKT